MFYGKVNSMESHIFFQVDILHLFFIIIYVYIYNTFIDWY